MQEYTDATAELRQHLLECCGEECFQQPDQFEALGQKVWALQACRQHPHMLECLSSPTKTLPSCLHLHLSRPSSSGLSRHW